ncbi:MAG: undecaprenyldiphospho-muramoylpentapeptide beta-N-acetylglucosaminyltransferase [Rickettsiales bacterium]|nr:undecaprenyldiphospho-muramoylpentapeptide beta-N-acetylglucosaminyltransferase [Rickettsiales bacterium]
MSSRNAIITTGGTAGHIFPAASLASLLRERGYSVLFIGNEKMEEYVVKLGFSYAVVGSGKNLRSFKSFFSILRGVWQSFRIIKKFKPDILIGFGSYVTVPVLLAARLTKTPFYLHEQNLCVGDTNRFFLKYAKHIFTSLPEIYGVEIDHSNKIYFTGNPVRREIQELRNAPTYRCPGSGETLNILITGGSGGASFLVTELLKAFHLLKKKTKMRIKVFHQVKKDEELEMAKRFYDDEMIASEVKLFFNDMPEKMLQSHLIICRSGMGTASELAMVGRPAIFIPSPNVKNNHQLRNAKFFERNGACIVVEEADFSPKGFASNLEFLAANGEKLLELATNMRKLAVVDAGERIVNCLDNDLEQLN